MATRCANARRVVSQLPQEQVAPARCAMSMRMELHVYEIGWERSDFVRRHDLKDATRQHRIVVDAKPSSDLGGQSILRVGVESAGNGNVAQKTSGPRTVL
ncbi:MAG TPA: hypothetical protein VJN70_10230 [Gemmatimonadaceae bacterium]|nr:hypothetical protein [Gemmatimonadaceae bacterium]